MDNPNLDESVVENLNVVDVNQWVAHDEEEAYQLYCSYAHNLGFSVRKEHNSFYPNSRKLKDKDYVCSKAGNRKEPNPLANRKYKRPNTRTDCPAMIRFGVSLDGIWQVKKFVECHNHELAKSEDQHLLRSSRDIEENRSHVLQTMTAAGIRTIDAFSYLSQEVGGPEHVGFLKKDAYNLVQKGKRTRIENGDTTTLIKLFNERQSSDSMFSWDVEVDEEGRLMNFFWVDGIGRLDYDSFGDVIVFDTSYRLNKYNLACAPIIGINNHWQNVLLGVAFLSDETIESFTWLFTTFLRIMGDKHPATIFTDQDQAMSRAIEIALPNTSHRLCQWHISKKIPSKVSCYNSKPLVRNRFYECLSKCDSEEEFNQAWESLISEGNLENHPWLQDLHRIRHKWSTAFNKDTFNLGILSTQRSESTNNVCHGMCKPTSSITDCFLALESIMANWRRNERDEDHKCNQTEIVPVVKSSPILKQAANFYSQRLYSFFQQEFLEGVSGFTVQQLSDSNDHIVKSLGGPANSKSWTVNFNATEGSIQCSCKKFETMGLLCSHCIKVMNAKDVLSIPKQYLLPRWSCTAKKDYYLKKEICEAGTSSKGAELIFRRHISKSAYEMSTRAQGNKAVQDYMCKEFEKISNGINTMLTRKTINSPKKKGTRTKNKTVKTSEFVIKDPAKVRPKGISNARLKGYWEKTKRPRVSIPEDVGSQYRMHVNTRSAQQGLEELESQLGQNYKEGADIDAVDRAGQVDERLYDVYERILYNGCNSFLD